MPFRRHPKTRPNVRADKVPTTAITSTGENIKSRFETIEITHGFNDWFETGFYIFTSARNGSGWDFVGTHIRPRFRVPPKWHWPVGVSLSQEIGYVRRQFSEDTWSWEIRPIIDKEIKRWYLSFNPALERSLNGPGKKRGFGFSPNFKVAYSLTKKID